MKTIGDQAKEFRLVKGWNKTEMAAAVQKHFSEGPVNRQKITQLEEAGDRRPQYLAALAKTMGTTVETLEAGRWSQPEESAPIESSIPIAVAPMGSDGTDSIEVLFAKGSCGGGSMPLEGGDDVREVLVKEAGWFKKYNVRPGQTIAIYADGNSMAEFIVDGDIVIFKKGVVDLIGGQIYVIDTPDGLRIKRVLKRSDGTIVLSSDSDNKRRYPDEVYTPEQAEALKFKGSFIYRQGG